MTVQEFMAEVGRRTHSRSWQSLHRLDRNLYECAFNYSGNRGIQIDVTTEALEDAISEFLVEGAVTHILKQLALVKPNQDNRTFKVEE